MLQHRNPIEEEDTTDDTMYVRTEKFRQTGGAHGEVYVAGLRAVTRSHERLPYVAPTYTLNPKP
jgi:hypothetical protein